MEVASGGRDLGSRALKSFLWHYGAISSGKVFFFLATLVLAHQLEPADFGVIAFTLAVLGFIETVTSHGIGETLVFRKDALDPGVSSTAFWLSLTTAAAFTVVMWILAPAIAELGPESESLVLVVRVLSLGLLLTSLGSVSGYLLQHSMRFDRAFTPQLISGFVKGVTAVVLALAGLGVWSLVFGQLAGTLVRSAGLWIVNAWRPSFTFARDKARSIIKTGGGFSATAIVGGLARNADYLIIGVTLGTTALGYYYIAFRLPELLVLGPFEAVWQVLLPYYARLRDGESDPGAARRTLEQGFANSVRIGSLIAFPLSVTAAALASPLMLTLYGDAWAPAIVPFALIALWAGTNAVSGMAGVVLKSLGRTGTLLTASLVATSIRLPLLWLGTSAGISGVALTQLVAQAIWLVGIYAVVARVLDVRLRSVLSPLAPAVLVSLGVGAAVLFVAQTLPPLPGLVGGVLIGLAVYAILLRLLCADVLRTVIKTVRDARPARLGTLRS